MTAVPPRVERFVDLNQDELRELAPDVEILAPEPGGTVTV